MNLLDYILLAFLALGALNGWRRGMLAIIVGLAGLLLAWYVASRYAPTAAQWLDFNVGWVRGLSRLLAGRLPLPAALAAQPLAGLTPDQVNQLLTAMPFPATLMRPLATAAAATLLRAPELGLTTLGDLVYHSLALLVWTAISFFVIMALTSGLANILAWAVTRTLDGTPLSGLNHLTGLALGAAENLVILVVLAGLLTPLLNLLRWPALHTYLSDSVLVTLFADWFQRWSPWKIM